MDLGTQLIILIIFGVVGFITDKIWGINPYKIFSDIGAAIFLITLIFFAFPASTDPNIVAKNIENMVYFFAESFPSMVIGDIAGTIVSEITGKG
ncbi:MAG: hypothetical protein ACXQS6_04215 [Candidatus Syntropharchaeales archaeon]